MGDGLRNQVFVLDHMYMSVFATCGWILRLGVTVALLVSIHPALALLAVFALPTVLTSTWRPGVERAAEERGAQGIAWPDICSDRHHGAAGQGSARHGHRRAAGRRAARGVGAVVRPGRGRALGHARRGTRSAWAVFGAAYVGAVVFVSSGLARPAGRRAAGAGRRLAPVGVHRRDGRRDRLPARHLDGRLAAPRVARGLRGVARGLAPIAPAPDAACARASGSSTCRSPIPAPTRLVLDDVSLTLPAGSVVAIVGENGAGKTTLVKLLRKLYEPTPGRILVDDAPLARMPRRRVARAPGRRVPGLLPLRVPRAPHAWASATCRAWTTSRRSSRRWIAPAPSDVVARLPRGLDTQLGPTWPGGVEVSFGQWQKLALARGFMRDQPLLLVLDEPTAALDAETEHALFERYAAAARGGGHGGDGRRPHHDPRVAPLLDGAHGRPDRRARRRPRGRGRHARGADGQARPVRRAVRHPGRCVPLTRAPAEGVLCL